jgi:hypothetical protein
MVLLLLIFMLFSSSAHLSLLPAFFFIFTTFPFTLLRIFYFLFNSHSPFTGACGSIVGWGSMLQAGRSQVRFLMTSLDFLYWPNPSSRTMALGSTQPLTEMSTRNLPGGKGRPIGTLRLTSPPSLSRFSRENVAASTSHNPMGFHDLLQG